ncbi:ankyrin repeat domain-containing protein SOWAHC-like isoform X2 [Ptychodera flava]|uniref:ankyrin repeat domain-containing protein SOWAHC-like isoform X2 n=1 Tax=Ptychodera flava TaxID=63121 RepID=UPI00396A83F6
MKFVMSNMADDDQLEFSEIAIRDFLVKHGGKVKNEDLVKKFKPFLSDPDNKARNREKFKVYVNGVAQIKTEDGEKWLVLKKKYRELVHQELTETDSRQEKENKIQETPVDIAPEQGKPDDDTSQELSEVKKRVLAVAQSFEKKAEEEKAQAEAAWVSPSAKVQSEEDGADDESVSSTVTVVTVKGEESNQADIKECGNEDQLQDNTSDVIEIGVDGSEGSEPPSVSSSEKQQNVNAEVTQCLNENEKKWMLEASEGNAPMLASLLVNEPNLYKQKTALHWAAKHGNKEMIKLLAGRRGLDINTRSVSVNLVFVVHAHLSCLTWRHRSSVCCVTINVCVQEPSMLATVDGYHCLTCLGQEWEIRHHLPNSTPQCHR